MMNSTAARNQLQLRGPRPPPLTVNKSSTKIFKKSTTNLLPIPNRRDRRSPVIVYLRSPKIVHVRPEEFKSFVQRLTGNRSSVAVVASSFSPDAGMITDHPGDEFVSAAYHCIPS